VTSARNLLSLVSYDIQILLIGLPSYLTFMVRITKCVMHDDRIENRQGIDGKRRDI